MTDKEIGEQSLKNSVNGLAILWPYLTYCEKMEFLNKLAPFFNQSLVMALMAIPMKF